MDHRVLLLAFCLVAGWAQGVLGYTDPGEYQRLVEFRDKYKTKSDYWAAALATWTCPTAANNSKGSDCDPCGETWWGNWDHISCRSINTLQDADTVPGVGFVTNLHFSKTGVDGVPPPEFCNFKYTQEVDIKNSNLDGPLPTYLGGNLSCLPELQEYDYSFNNMSGPIPVDTGTIPLLTEFKMQGNHLTGPVPDSFGNLKSLQWLRVYDNELTGTFGPAFQNVNPQLTQLSIGGNGFSGNLYSFANVYAQNTNITFLPKMCGMVPVGVEYGNGYNLEGSPSLGLPCPDEVSGGWPSPTS